MRLTVRSGEEVIEKKVLIAALCNGKQFGGGIPMCPAANIGGWAFECGRRRLPQAFQDPRGAFEAHAGKVLSLPFARHYTCEEVSIVPASPAVAQYDGELYQTAAMEATLKKGGILMYRA